MASGAICGLGLTHRLPCSRPASSSHQHPSGQSAAATCPSLAQLNALPPFSPCGAHSHAHRAPHCTPSRKLAVISKAFRGSDASGSGAPKGQDPWNDPNASLTRWPATPPPPNRPAGAAAAAPAPAADARGSGPSLDVSPGLFGLIAFNAAIFAAAVYVKLPAAASLALYNSGGAWWQYVTSAFVHANLAHLSRNMFLLWLWGSALQRVVTGPGVWFTYIICALGSNLAAAQVMGLKAKAGPALLGMAASGGCAGVALAAALVTARPSLRWLLGAALAAQFTLPAILAMPVPGMSPMAGSAPAAGQALLAKVLPAWLTASAVPSAGAGAAVQGAAGQGGFGGVVSALQAPGLAWLWGAAAGAVLVAVLAKLPVPPE